MYIIKNIDVRTYVYRDASNLSIAGPIFWRYGGVASLLLDPGEAELLPGSTEDDAKQ